MPDFFNCQGHEEFSRETFSQRADTGNQVQRGSGVRNRATLRPNSEAINDPHVKAVIKDIIAEERLCAGQFLELLYRLAPDEKAIYEKGHKENQELK